MFCQANDENCRPGVFEIKETKTQKTRVLPQKSKFVFVGYAILGTGRSGRNPFSTPARQRIGAHSARVRGQSSSVSGSSNQAQETAARHRVKRAPETGSLTNGSRRSRMLKQMQYSIAITKQSIRILCVFHQVWAWHQSTTSSAGRGYMDKFSFPTKYCRVHLQKELPHAMRVAKKKWTPFLFCGWSKKGQKTTEQKKKKEVPSPNITWNSFNWQVSPAPYFSVLCRL